jgi:thiol-disulfide isomerase/thioredoxin
MTLAALTSDPLVVRAAAVIVLVTVVAAVGAWWRARRGRVRVATSGRVAPHHLDAVGLDLTDAEVGAVLLGSPTCAPCTAVKRVLDRLATERTGLRWVDVDVADHLEVAEAHGVLRVPTLLVVDRDGRLLARAQGVPSAEDLLAAFDGRGRLAKDAAA